MDFWTAINDVSAVFTVSTFVWQAGKALFKKIHFVPHRMRNAFKKNGNRLTHNPVAFFKKPSRVLILEEPGCGKTQLLLQAYGRNLALQKKLA